MSKQAYQESTSPDQKKHYARFLAEDEELVVVTGFSRIYLRQKFIIYLALPGAIFILGGLGLGYWLQIQPGYGLLIGLLLAALIAFLRTYWINLANKYILTTRRVIIKTGLFTNKLSSALYDKITHIEVEQGFIDRLFLNHGKIIINTAGSNKDELVLKYVESPIQFKNLLERLINREREQYGRQTGPVVSLEGELVE